MDLPGQLRLFLQSCLFRKYLNYSHLTALVFSFLLGVGFRVLGLGFRV